MKYIKIFEKSDEYRFLAGGQRYTKKSLEVRKSKEYHDHREESWRNTIDEIKNILYILKDDGIDYLMEELDHYIGVRYLPIRIEVLPSVEITNSTGPVGPCASGWNVSMEFKEFRDRLIDICIENKYEIYARLMPMGYWRFYLISYPEQQLRNSNGDVVSLKQKQECEMSDKDTDRKLKNTGYKKLN